MSDTVTINVDGKDYEVAAGANLVDAAKWHAGTRPRHGRSDAQR